MTPQDAENLVTLATVMVRQTDVLHAMVGNVRDLQHSSPTEAEVLEMKDRFDQERDFAHFTLGETNALLRRIQS